MCIPKFLHVYRPTIPLIPTPTTQLRRCLSKRTVYTPSSVWSTLENMPRMCRDYGGNSFFWLGIHLGCVEIRLGQPHMDCLIHIHPSKYINSSFSHSSSLSPSPWPSNLSSPTVPTVENGRIHWRPDAHQIGAQHAGHCLHLERVEPSRRDRRDVKPSRVRVASGNPSEHPLIKEQFICSSI